MFHKSARNDTTTPGAQVALMTPAEVQALPGNVSEGAACAVWFLPYQWGVVCLRLNAAGEWEAF